jgi:uncharacterized NAD-dependent epimerase/dehydratase family protein
VIELLSGKPVVAITINHEGLSENHIPSTCDTIRKEVNLPVFDVLRDGSEGVVKILNSYLK